MKILVMSLEHDDAYAPSYIGIKMEAGYIEGLRRQIGKIMAIEADELAFYEFPDFMLRDLESLDLTSTDDIDRVSDDLNDNGFAICEVNSEPPFVPKHPAGARFEFRPAFGERRVDKNGFVYSLRGKHSDTDMETWNVSLAALIKEASRHGLA